ncbi:MAG TPA: hypothetical protein VKY22_05625 [Bradyrhizobium sp.]|nr:hypothetical protein [Bradyrhizobium sp.]
MEQPPHSTLHALFAAQAPKPGRAAADSWIAVFLEALYDLQRHQALGVIRAYEHFLGLPDDRTEPSQDAGEDRGDTVQ